MVNIQDAMDAESMQLLGPVEFAGRNSMLGDLDQQDSLVIVNSGASRKMMKSAILGTYICDMCVFYYIYYMYLLLYKQFSKFKMTNHTTEVCWSAKLSLHGHCEASYAEGLDAESMNPWGSKKNK